MLYLPISVQAEQGQWLIRVGANTISPKSNNGDVVEVDNATMVTFNGTYFVADQWAVEMLAALPYRHDVNLIGGGRVAETKHLPPTLSLQYHFLPDNNWRPYVGAGVNYTLFFEESTRGALEGTNLQLEDSVGLALQLGVDVDVNETWFVNAVVRYMDIDAKAKLNGASLGTVTIDPWTFGLNLGLRF